MQTLWQDFRYALRQLRNAPGFALTGILTLALGIGATIGVYTLVDAILLRPLPYSDPNHLFVVDATNSSDHSSSSLTYANLNQLVDRSQGQLAAGAVITSGNVKLQTSGHRSPVLLVETTANLSSVLGVQPRLGRSFRPEENEPGKNHVLILSDWAWREIFSTDPGVVGRTASVRGEIYTVIGVMPPSFAVPMDSWHEVWTPAAIPAAGRMSLKDEDLVWLNTVFVRPTKKMDARQVGAELNRLQGQIVREQHNPDLASELVPTQYLTTLNHQVKKPLLLLLSVSASFWLLASFNTVGLLIARAIAREREFAVRSALGASRLRLLRQSIVESLLMSAAGAALGLLLAIGAVKVMWHAIERSLPLTERIHVGAYVLLALVAITMLTGVMAGLIPALRASGRSVQHGLRGGSAPLPRADQHRLRSTLVAAQLMITLVLLAGAGLFLRTITALRAVPLGFSEQNVLTGGIMLHPVGHQLTGRNALNIAQQYYMPLIDRLNRIPGVQSATLSSVMPMRSEFQIHIGGRIDGKEGNGTTKYMAAGRAASPGLPETFGIPMLRGRFFTADDTAGSPPVVVVNQAFVKAYLPNTDPSLHTFGLGEGKFGTMRIIGVIGDVKQGSLDESTTPEVYLCLAQVEPGTPFYQPITAFMQVGIRARIPAQLLRKQFEATLDRVDPDAQAIDVKTIHEAVEDSFGDQALIAHLLEGFSAMALLIASVGLYGTVAFSVAQRTREFGVRLALGAPEENIRRLVFKKALRPVFLGLLAGDIALWFAARLIRSYLFGVAPRDVATFLIASLTLLVAAGIAASIPARRAASIDPMQALRAE